MQRRGASSGRTPYLLRQFSPLLIGKPQSPAFQLRSEDVIFGLEIRDHCLLLPDYPTGENHHQKCSGPGILLYAFPPPIPPPLTLIPVRAFGNHATF